MRPVGRTWGAALKKNDQDDWLVFKKIKPHNSSMFGGIGGRGVASDMFVCIVDERMTDVRKRIRKDACFEVLPKARGPRRSWADVGMRQL
jgi:hypothetical protein